MLNAASNAFQGLPNSGIAQGSIFVVYGTGLGPAPPAGQAVTSATFPLGAELPGPQGTSIQVTVNGTAVNALMLYTSPNQIAAILPSHTPGGTGTMTVSYHGRTSAPPAPIKVVANSVGIFTLSQTGSGPAVAQNYVSQTSLPLNTLTTPARAGQTLVLYATGLGPVTFDESGPAKSGNVGSSVELLVGGRKASVAYHGRSSCCAGLDQINFVVPAGTDGCYVPVAITDGGVVSNFATISVAPAGQACSDPLGFNGTDFQKLMGGGVLKIGKIILAHSMSPAAKRLLTGLVGAAALAATSDATSNATSNDSVAAFFQQIDAGFLTQSRGLSRLPSIGSCVVMPGNLTSSDLYRPKALDAGLSVEIKGGPTGETVSVTPFPDFPGFYGIGALPDDFPDAGAYTASNGPGGKDVTAFNASATFGAPVIWANQNDIQTVVRSQSVRVTWTGGAAGGLVVISGNSLANRSAFELPSDASFVCLAHVEDQQFSVPSAVLESLPPSVVLGAGIGSGSLSVSGLSFKRFTGGSLDYGIFIDLTSSDYGVTYR